ncbi:TenA family transcriptional regulator [bacterium]|nr:MAG: TenA family transcriptional regulator [bacterium]
MATADLISRHSQEWRSAVDHPFLAGVRDGTLPARAFDRWLAQDYLFVTDLLGFQAGLLALAPRPAQRVLAGGLVALESELTWFEASAAERGLRLGGERHSSTEAYRVALDQLLAEGPAPAVTALWAMERVYLEAWRGAAPGAPRYRAFVEHWTVPEFAAYVLDLEGAATDGPLSEAAFLQICRLELDFWDMAWGAA